METGLGWFADDDYERVNAEYFEQILRDRTWESLPAGWHNPYSSSAEQFRISFLEKEDIQRYTLDEGLALKNEKWPLINLFRAWEGRIIHYNELTLCPSVSTANLIVLFTLKSFGFETVIFETPAYYATLDQARLLGLRSVRLPTYRSNDFQLDCDDVARVIRAAGRCALWLTHPRFGIGINQSLEHVRKLGSLLGTDNALMIDEAAEQNFPSLLRTLSDEVDCPVIRTRGIVKGIGLNGLRAAAIVHPASWRGELERNLEPAGGSLDRFSLVNAGSLAADEALLPTMLAAANAQVRKFQRKISTLSLGSWLRPTPLENGYIGTLMLDLSELPGSYDEKRAVLLDYCRAQRMPIVTRASIGFAFDADWEGVRINYFTPENNVERSVRLLMAAPEIMAHRLSGCSRPSPGFP